MSTMRCDAVLRSTAEQLSWALCALRVISVTLYSTLLSDQSLSYSTVQYTKAKRSTAKRLHPVHTTHSEHCLFTSGCTAARCSVQYTSALIATAHAVILSLLTLPPLAWVLQALTQERPGVQYSAVQCSAVQWMLVALLRALHNFLRRFGVPYSSFPPSVN